METTTLRGATGQGGAIQWTKSDTAVAILSACSRSFSVTTALPWVAIAASRPAIEATEEGAPALVQTCFDAFHKAAQ